MKVQEQAAAVRRGAGLFRLTHRGLVSVEGRDRVRWLNGMVSNDVAALEPGPDRSGCYALLLTQQGRIVADLQILLRADSLWLETEAEAVGPLIERLEKFIVADAVELADRTAAFTRLALEGPEAPAILKKSLDPMGEALSMEKAPDLAPDACADLRIADWPVVVAATGWSGEKAFQLLVATDGQEPVTRALLAAGADRGLVRAGLEVLEILRIEAGRPRLGLDLDESVLPAEARLERAISTQKGCYTGQEIVARLASQGQVGHWLVGLEADGSAPLTVEAEVTVGDRRVGEVTSACVSPIAGSIGLAYVRRGFDRPGTELGVETRRVRVASLPWVFPPRSP
ncbi:MAG: aminomethyltransferase family protein [Myxococcota bacterium]